MTRALVCPGCRSRSPGRLDLQTLERDGDLLICPCGRRYPIVGGVPIVLVDPQRAIGPIAELDHPPEVAAALAAPGPDGANVPRLLEHLSTYLDAHWGDRATPAPSGPGAEPPRALIERIAARAAQPVELAVELGCSAGRMVAELAAGAEHVIGVELHHGALRHARRVLAGEAVSYARRMIGRHYEPARIAPIASLAERTTLVCGDALDPPLVPGVFDRVVALNVVDSVPNPAQLLDVIRGLCAPGGEVILASPYTWRSDVMLDDHRLGGADPAATLRAAFADYTIEDEDDLPWILRMDARSAVTYRVHYLRARKV